MDILKDNCDSPLEYVVSLFNISCNTNIIQKQIKICIQYLWCFLKNNTCFYQWHFVSFVHFNLPYQSFKKLKNSNEHSHLIVELNATQKIKIKIDWAFYDNNISELLEVCPNLIYYAKNLNSSTCFQILKEPNHILGITQNIYTQKNHKNLSYICSMHFRKN
jgi:hypothetical protein